jgi:UDP-2,3-diacylglucosamine hydrolase
VVGDAQLIQVPPVGDRPLIVLSDVHLGAVPASTERALRSFLDHVAGTAAALLINGDLFDVWLATHHFVVRKSVRVLARLAELVEGGLPIYFVGGNHDPLELGGGALREDIGIVTLDEPALLAFGSHRLLVVHGDGVRPGRQSYAKRHPILRHPAFRWTAERLLHVDRLVELIARSSATPRFVASHLRGEGTGPKPMAPVIEAWAREELRRDRAVNVVLAAHSHLPACVAVEPGRFYVNSGDWISHMTYAIVPPRGAPTVERWDTA